ncbi:CCR4-NOT transcription complex subunit 10-A [Toxocara canis]|uniref:CCR4-NOT transcription complex subunit 10 n=1 Tax=Toxocara canis TaxID=6265 RepID=A0A0B2VUY6_TOXCA|nr:CCR4-NOT transcription complex subunit 10-A [Toxocara canis]
MRSNSVGSSVPVSSDPAYLAYSSNDFQRCHDLLTNARSQTQSELEKRRLSANIRLCEARRNAQLFSAEYTTAMLQLFPELASPLSRPLKTRAEAFAAFNLALNAFARGNRRTAIELLQAILALNGLPDKLFFVVSLLEIEMSLTLCQPKLALKQALRLRDNPTWRRAHVAQRDYLDCLECRIRCRLAQTASLVDHIQKPQILQWCLLQSELDMKNGNASRALSRLLKFRPSLQDQERRLVDNAIGCVYALSLKKAELAESWQESTIPRHCLIYHAALAQLHSGQAESAFRLFLSVLPFYPRQPRIWLRIAECCIYALSKNGGDEESNNGGRGDVVKQTIGYGVHRHVVLATGQNNRNDFFHGAVDPLASNEISWEYAAQCVRNALVLTGGERDCVYLLPWLYAASAFINLNLGRHGLALRAATHLAGLPQVSPHHKLLAVLFKTEALVLLDRLPEAVDSLAQAVPLQSMPSTISAVIYNRALLQALSGNLRKSLSTLAMLNAQRDIVVPSEATPLEVYVNIRLGKNAEARRIIEEHLNRGTMS